MRLRVAYASRTRVRHRHTSGIGLRLRHPGSSPDRCRARLKRVVDRKRKGETIKTPKASEEPETPADLMAALERTLEELQSGNGRRR
jgi:non-homologous end joining protein Ku